MNFQELVIIIVLINNMETPQMSVKVVIVHVIIVMVEMIINAPHVLNPNIYLIILVIIVTLVVMVVLQQEQIIVMHV